MINSHTPCISLHLLLTFHNNCFSLSLYVLAALGAQMVKNLPAVQKTQVRSLGREAPLEKGMATHSSILAWTEEPGGLQSMGLQRGRHS